MNKTCVNSVSLFNARMFGYSHVVVASTGQMVFISGQVAWDEKMHIIGKGDLEQQTERAVLNLKTAIEAAGDALSDIVMLTIYKVGSHKDEGTIVGCVLRKYFGTEEPPASTWLNVSGLANDDFMIEIGGQAIIRTLAGLH